MSVGGESPSHGRRRKPTFIDGEIPECPGFPNELASAAALHPIEKHPVPLGLHLKRRPLRGAPRRTGLRLRAGTRLPAARPLRGLFDDWLDEKRFLICEINSNGSYYIKSEERVKETLTKNDAL